MEQAVLLEQSGDGSAEGAHAAGDGDLIALGRLIERDSHVVHLKALVGQLEAGAHQLCQIGIHIHRGQQQLFGVRVRVVVIKASLGLLDAVHAAPDGGFAQGQIIDVLDTVKGQRVKQDQTFQPVLIFRFLLGVVKQGGHTLHTGPHDRYNAHQRQHGDQQAKGLPGAAAVEPGVFFRGHIGFHIVIVS